MDRKIERLINKARRNGKKIYIRGLTYLGIMLGVYLDENGILFEGFIDINPRKQNKEVFGNHKCFPPLHIGKDSFVFITVLAEKYKREIEDELTERGIDHAADLEEDIFELGKNLNDAAYIKALFQAEMGYALNLDAPQTFNEKLQWLKLYDRRPIYTVMADKYAVKEYVAGIIGKEYIIPTFGVWDNFKKIDFDALPEMQFVLKCTHDSGGVVICKNKARLDMKSAERRIEQSLNRNYYYPRREWPYKDIKPRIIAEKYIASNADDDLMDYKFFCFDGVARFMFIASERQSTEETKFDFYDMDFNHLPFINGHPNSPQKLDRPKSFEKMKSLAEKLSVGIPQIRIDFYDVDGQVYFGEMTLFHWSGLVPFEPMEWDYKFGEMIILPQRSCH